MKTVLHLMKVKFGGVIEETAKNALQKLWVSSVNRNFVVDIS